MQLSLDVLLHSSEYEPGTEIVVLNQNQPFWTTSHYTYMYTLFSGHKLVQIQSLQVDTFFETVQRFKVRQFQFLYKLKKCRRV